MPGGHLSGQRPGRQCIPCGVAEESASTEPPAELRIITLGQFAVWSARLKDGTPHWGRDEALKLLKCLLAAPSFRRTCEQLMALLWPDFDPRPAREALRHALSRLRRTLEPASTNRASARYAGSDREAIWLQCGPSSAPAPTDTVRDVCVLWIDRLGFERETEAALAALAAAHDGAPLDMAVSSARRALKLYRGAFLPNDVYADWTRPPRDRCQHLWASLICRLSVLMAVRDRDYERAALLLEQLVEAMPDDENAVALLMLVQAVGGHRGEALRTYDTLRRRLKRHFDMVPTEDLEVLATSIRTGMARDRLVALLAAELREDPPGPADDFAPLDLRELAHLASPS